MRINEDFTVSSVDLFELQNEIGITYKDKRYLIQSLLHKSFFDGDKTKLDAFKKSNNLEADDYEKLEYLGNSVLNLIVDEYSYNDKMVEEYAKAQNRTIDGVLTNFKIVLVSNESLGPVANKINLDRYILYGVVENVSDLYDKVIESLIGSIFLDQGFSKAKEFVKNFFDFEGALGKIEDSNPKSTLKEIGDQIGCTPVYETINEEGPGNKKKYTVRLIFIEKETIGFGTKIQKAEVDAAKKFLSKYLDNKSRFKILNNKENN